MGITSATENSSKTISLENPLNTEKSKIDYTLIATGVSAAVLITGIALTILGALGTVFTAGVSSVAIGIGITLITGSLISGWYFAGYPEETTCLKTIEAYANANSKMNLAELSTSEREGNKFGCVATAMLQNNTSVEEAIAYLDLEKAFTAEEKSVLFALKIKQLGEQFTLPKINKTDILEELVKVEIEITNLGEASAGVSNSVTTILQDRNLLQAQKLQDAMMLYNKKKYPNAEMDPNDPIIKAANRYSTLVLFNS